MDPYIQSRRLVTRTGEIFLPDSSRCSYTMGSRLYEHIRRPSRSVVFAFDSVNYFEFRQHFSGHVDLHDLECFTSVFPTGSPTAFSSIFFNAPATVHRIFGIAFFSEIDGGVYQTSKGMIIDSRNNGLREGRLPIRCRSILDDLPYPSYYVFTNNVWHSSPLWKRFAGSADRVMVEPLGHYKEKYDRTPEITQQLSHARRLMEMAGDRLIWVFLDLDETLHQQGVKTATSQQILGNLAASVGNLMSEFPDFDYFLLADHGQIDLRGTYEFPYEGIQDLCYAHRGGLGRTHYFYTRSPEAFEMIAREVGDTGIVLRKSDPLLHRIFGFDPSPFPEIGDVVAVATTPAFPSYGWKMAAEHGALSKEEVFVPFLHICRRA